MKLRPCRDLVGAALFFAFGGLVAGMATELPMGNMRLPGPGAFPIAIGIALMALAVARFLQTARTPAAVSSSADGDEPEPRGHARVLLVCALVAVFVLVLPVIGFLLASILLMTALYMIGAGGRFSVAPVAAGVITACVAYAIFAVMLDVPLPRGTLWGL